MRKQSRRRERQPELPVADRADLDRLEPLYTIDEIVQKTRRSRAAIYRDIAAKRLEITKLFGSTRVTQSQYSRYIGVSD
jgi:hypothetical protein